MNIEHVELHDRLRESYMSYAMATIVDRALPDVRSGLLPIHTRLLYAMYNRGLLYNKPYAKSSEPVSETMKIHHHGDMSIYGSLALMTDRNESLLYPLIDGDGSFGKVYLTDSPSSSRYTYCRLNKFAMEMFQNIQKGVVKMIDDGEHVQPTVLPVTYPSILVKPNKAIAVGEACNWGSFNLVDVCKFTADYINDKTINPIDYLIPDFSTGGYLIYDKNKLQNILDTGKDSIRLRAKYTYDRKNNKIRVTEIPYGTTVQSIMKEIVAKMNTTLKDIIDVKDACGFNKKTNLEQLGLSISLKNNANVDLVVKKLFKETSLESNFSFNMNCLVDNKPVVLGVKAILDEWLKFRRECIVKSIQYDLDKKNKDLYLLQGLEKITLDIDKAVNIIRFNENPKNDLMNEFKIDDVQAEYVLNIKLRNINKNYIVNQTKDIEQMKSEVDTLNSNMNDINYINQCIINDLNRVSKEYGKPRKTEIIYEDELQEISADELIEEYNCRLLHTKEGYIKKHLKQSDNHKLKDGDIILSDITSTNKSTILLFTNKGNRYSIPCHQLETLTPQSFGTFIPNLINLEDGEEVIKIISVEEPKGYIISCYKNGKIAKVDINSYMSANKKLANCYSKESDLLQIEYIKDDVDVLLASTEGKALVVNTSNINPKASRTSQGNIAMRLDNHSIVGCIIDVDKDTKFEIITHKEKVKDFILDDIAPTGRPNEERNLLIYLSGRCGNGGNFIHNSRINNDLVKEFQII